MELRQRLNGRFLGIAAAAGATIVWGGMFPIAGSLLATIDPLTMTAIRYGIAASLLVLLLAAREGTAALHPQGRLLEITLSGAIGFAAFNLLLYSGVRLSTPAHGALIMATTPTLAMIAVALRERRWPKPLAVASVFAAFVGVGLVITHGDLRVVAGGGVGDALMIGAALCWVTYTLGARRFNSWSPLRFTALSAAAGAIASIALTMGSFALGITHAPSAATLVNDLPGMAYMTVLAAFFSIFAWNVALRRLGPSSTTLFMNLVPITAFTIAIVRGAHVPSIEIAGAIVTIAALIVNNFAMRTGNGTVVKTPAADASPVHEVRGATT
jgi:drug/metabolite transporter (DMT)-like permease